jgi:Transposase DDE domain group 1
VIATFDGGAITSGAGALLLREADRAIGLLDRVAACFDDRRQLDAVVHAAWSGSGLSPLRAATRT